MRKSELVIDVLLFAGTVVLAQYQQWTAKDLVWGLWISSLTLGYSYILVSIAGMLINPEESTTSTKEGEPKKQMTVEGQGIVMSFFFILFIGMITGFSYITGIAIIIALLSALFSIGSLMRKNGKWLFMPSADNIGIRIIIFLPFGLFMFCFFTIHFLGFHFVHSIFLNGFFPLINETPFGKTIEGTIFFFKDLIVTAASKYWMFICASGISRLDVYRKAFQKTGGNSMGYAYINVIRMHFLIFIIAFMSAAKLQSVFLYAILVLYFFPVVSLGKLFFKK